MPLIVRPWVDEASKSRWAFTPLVSVGPLQFGMTHDEVVTALDMGAPTLRMPGRWADFGFDVGVRTYYDESGRLSCVAVDPIGPQVVLDGMRLVGRVLSRVENWLCEYAHERGMQARFGASGCSGVDELGVMIRPQRMGDVVLTRPVFVALWWADDASDGDEGPIPWDEWSVH